MGQNNFIKENASPLAGENFFSLVSVLLQEGRDVQFKVKGHSMMPFIRDKDVVTVSPLQKKYLRRGSVVAFVHPAHNKLIIHRIIGQKNGGDKFIIKGDSCFFSDGSIPIDYIMGYIKDLQRGLKKIVVSCSLKQQCIGLLSQLNIIAVMFFFRTRLALSFEKRLRKGDMR